MTEIVNTRTYDACGKIIAETTPAVDHLFGFTGRPTEGETDLQNNLNRWYDPEVGTWINEDLIGFEGGDANLYRYCGNDPVNFVDPLGLQWDGIINPPCFDPPAPPPADGRCGRQHAMTVDELMEWIQSLPGVKLSVNTEERVEGGFILSPHALGQELGRQRKVLPSSDLEIAAQGGVMLGPGCEPPEIDVLEIHAHGGYTGIKFGPTLAQLDALRQRIGEGEEGNRDAMVAVLNTHMAKGGVIIIGTCNSGNLASSDADPSWVQELANRTRCTVIAMGGFWRGSFVVVGPGAQVNRVYVASLIEGSQPFVIEESRARYGSKDKTVYVFRPRIIVVPLPPDCTPLIGPLP